MRTTIIAIMLSVSLCGTAYILNRNFHDYTWLRRIAKAEIEIYLLQSKFEESNRNAQRVIDEVKCIVQEGYAPYDFIIPVPGGFLGIREKQNDKQKFK